MDPWNSDSSSIHGQNLELAKQVFENSFLAGESGGERLDKPVCDTNTVRRQAQRAQDSHLYISKLEERLRRVQCGETTGQGDSSSKKGSQLSEQLRQAKEDALIRLVRSNSINVVEEDDFKLEEELTTSYLYRRLAPQKTALTKGEKVLLLAADQLAIKLAESDISDSTEQDTSDDRRNTSEDALEEN